MAESEYEAAGCCVVAVPRADDAVHTVSGLPKHMTLLWLGLLEPAKDAVTQRVQQLLVRRWASEVQEYAAMVAPWTSTVESQGPLGDSDNVAFLASVDAKMIRDQIIQDGGPLSRQWQTVEQYPEFTPHVSLSNSFHPQINPFVEDSIEFDRLALWVGKARFTYQLGTGESV